MSNFIHNTKDTLFLQRERGRVDIGQADPQEFDKKRPHSNNRIIFNPLVVQFCTRLHCIQMITVQWKDIKQVETKMYVLIYSF